MILINGLPGRSIALALVLAGTSGCVRTVQAWPPPLTPGTSVRVHFATAHLVLYQRGRVQDSVAGVPELRGLVVALRGDTLVLRVKSDPARSSASDSREAERQATVVLDQSTTVTRTEIDGWKFSYALLAGAVLIFAGLVLSGS